MHTGKKLERWLVRLGALLLLCTAAFMLYQQWRDIQAGASSAAILEEQRQLAARPEMPVPEPAATISDTPTEAALKAEVEHLPERYPMPQGVLAILSIPKLERELPVWESCSEEQLKKTVCRYGEDRCGTGQLAIAGHSYRTHFRGLGRLEEGDIITLTFEDGARNYTVTAVEVIDGTDVDGFFSGQWNLSLFTCDATSKRRIVVRCEKQREEKEVKVMEK